MQSFPVKTIAAHIKHAVEARASAAFAASSISCSSEKSWRSSAYSASLMFNGVSLHGINSINSCHIVFSARPEIVISRLLGITTEANRTLIRSFTAPAV